jgi:DNA-binding LytR/AlgR family response regulator
MFMSKKLECIIIDDELTQGMILRKFIQETPFLEFNRLISDPREGFAYLSEHRPDLLFLDVEMPSLSGIELLKNLKNPPHTILVTAHAGFALEAYELDAIDYMLKPVQYPRFLKAAQKVQNLFNNHQQNQEDEDGKNNIFVKVGSKLIRLNKEEIVYIEALSDYIVVHTADGRKYVVYATLKYMEEQLRAVFGSSFQRVHRSFIINTNKIDFLEDTTVTMLGGKAVPVGNTYKNDFLNIIKKI